MKNIFLIILCLVTVNCFSQAATEKNVLLEKNKAPIELINEANKIAETDAPQSMQLATTALEKSIREGDKAGEYHSYNTLGSLYFNIGNFAKAAEYFTKSRDGFTAIKNDKGSAYAEKYLSLSLEKQKKYDEALKVNDEANRRNAGSNTYDQGQTKYNSARLKSKTGKKQEAITDLQNLSKANEVAPETKINIYNELGEIYAEQKDSTKAYWAYESVLNQDLPAANTTNNSTTRADYFNAATKISDLNLNAGRINENVVLQKKLLSTGQKSKDTHLVQVASYNLGNSYLKQEDIKQAAFFFSQSLDLAHKSGDYLQEQKAAKELALTYEKMGEHAKALQFYKRYVQLSDSFKSAQAGNDSASLALNREFLKQEQQIKSLMTTQEEKESSLRRQRYLLWGLGAGIIVFSLLTWALLRNISQKKKANMVIKLQSLRTQMNPHFIFNSLNSVNSFIAKSDERSANKYLSDFSKLMRSVLKNSDQDFVSLASEIETLGIYLGLEHFRFGDKFNFSLEVAPEVEPETVKIPPMLIQPYIENAIWHGLRYKEEKGILEVKIFIEEEKLFCTVYDNGIGRKRSAELKTLNQKSYQSTGIKNSKERIAILNKLHKTTLDISIKDLGDDGAESGTLVKISLPYIIQYEES